MASNPPGKCCTVGVKHEGEPTGSTIKVGQYEAYVAEPKGSNKHDGVALLYIPDVFGICTDVTYADLQCGGDTTNGIVGSSPAVLHASAAAGSTVTLQWTLWPESHVGPVITYMGRCPDTGCQDYMPGTDAIWFKIAEAGRDGTSDSWGDSSLMVGGNAGVQYTIPSCLKAGYYLVRHEIIALHAAYSYPGAQFYPGCHQLNVTGSGTTTPSDLVAFPGAYEGTDAGITYDAYQATTYTIPGPDVFTC